MNPACSFSANTTGGWFQQWGWGPPPPWHRRAGRHVVCRGGSCAQRVVLSGAASKLRRFDATGWVSTVSTPSPSRNPLTSCRRGWFHHCLFFLQVAVVYRKNTPWRSKNRGVFDGTCIWHERKGVNKPINQPQILLNSWTVGHRGYHVTSRWHHYWGVPSDLVNQMQGWHYEANCKPQLSGEIWADVYNILYIIYPIYPDILWPY